MNPFPIDYAFRPRLRGRLTLGRRPLPRKPSAFGEGDSHPLFRYSCLHSHFRYLQLAFQLTFSDLRNVHLPLCVNTQSAASVHNLAPLHCRRTTTRPVSCYALVQGMAASKPTSWLSSPLHFLFHSVVFWDLSWRSGLFPSRPRILSPAV
jgi:hypothetical protein